MNTKPQQRRGKLTLTDPARRLEYFEKRKADLVQTLRQFVEIESPSDNKQAVDRLNAFLAPKFQALGGRVTFHENTEFGNHLQVDFPGQRPVKPALLLGTSTQSIPWER